jgi:hypothetical protein
MFTTVILPLSHGVTFDEVFYRTLLQIVVASHITVRQIDATVTGVVENANAWLERGGEKGYIVVWRRAQPGEAVRFPPLGETNCAVHDIPLVWKMPTVNTTAYPFKALRPLIANCCVKSSPLKAR